jgi:hypothetical protein
MQTLFEQFVKERKYIKNVTPKTEDWYRQSWKALGESLPGDNMLPPKSYWTDRIGALRDRGVSAAAVNTYTRAINAFLRWAHR